ncbi:unnamed protein product [Closterium sp. NIES-54]
MALRPSYVPLRVPLPPPSESSLPAVPDPESDVARAANPTVSCLLATVVTDPSFESTAASALVAELVDFAAAYRLDYATALVAKSESASPPSVGGECALGTDVLEDTLEDFECLAAAVPHLVAMLLAPEGDPDALDISTPRSYAEAITGTYVDAVPPTGANIVDGMWIFMVKSLPGSPPAFKALGFTPSTADLSLFLPTNTTLPPFYVLMYVDDLVFTTAGTEALTLVKSELQKRHTCTNMGELRNYLGLQITRNRVRRTITLTQSHMVHQVLQCFGFHFSSPQPTPLSTGHSLSTPPLDESVEASGPYPNLVGCLITSGMGLMLGGRGPIILTGHADASWLPHDLGMYRKESRGKTILLVAYVDDLLYTSDNMELLDRFQVDIKEKLEVTINHNVTQFLGLNITESATSIHLSAAKYAETLAKKFVVAPINLTTPFHTPPPNHEPDITSLSIEDHQLYQQQLGCLLFAAVTCRPDLSVRGPLSEGLGFESKCVHFGHPIAEGCQGSTCDPRLILGKGYRLVVLDGYGCSDPLLNKSFYPNGLSGWDSDTLLRLKRARSVPEATRRGESTGFTPSTLILHFYS